MTLKEWQRFIGLQLAQKYALEEANQLSKILIQHYTGANSTTILLSEAEYVPPEHYEHDIQRLLNDEPWQYVIGVSEFCGLPIAVNSAVLIPRPETEELVHLISSLVSGSEAAYIIDICSGSGCIALALKHLYPHARVVAWEWSQEALALSKHNASNLDMEVVWQRMDALQADSYIEHPMQADIIVSNPPYVCRSESALMQANVLNFEPHMALFVPDDDALVFYNAIAKGAALLLRAGGYLFFEINEQLGEEVCAVMRQHGFSSIVMRNDFRGKPRFVYGVKS